MTQDTTKLLRFLRLIILESLRFYLGYAYAKAGQRAEAQAILGEVQKTKQYVSPAEFAILYVG